MTKEAYDTFQYWLRTKAEKELRTAYGESATLPTFKNRLMRILARTSFWAGWRAAFQAVEFNKQLKEHGLP